MSQNDITSAYFIRISLEFWLELLTIDYKLMLTLMFFAFALQSQKGFFSFLYPLVLHNLNSNFQCSLTVFYQKLLMKGSTLSSRDKSLLERVETPTEEVSLMQRVETKILAGINLNTLLIIHIQHLTIFYNKIPCKALHWSEQEVTRTKW